MKAILFDMDGTIVNNMSYHYKARIALLEKYGCKLTSTNIKKVQTGSFKSCLKFFFGDNITYEAIIKLGCEKQVLYKKLYKDHVTEVEGFSRLLQNARKRSFIIGMATMSSLDNVNFILGHLKVQDYFDIIISGEQISNGKPNPEIYNTLLGSLQCKPEMVIAFEDSLDGILSAKQAGIPVFGVCTRNSKKDFLNWGAISSINNFKEFDLDYVNRDLAKN